MILIWKHSVQRCDHEGKEIYAAAVSDRYAALSATRNEVGEAFEVLPTRKRWAGLSSLTLGTPESSLVACPHAPPSARALSSARRASRERAGRSFQSQHRRGHRGRSRYRARTQPSEARAVRPLAPVIYSCSCCVCHAMDKM